jgi:aromatic amino acid transport protein AroP
MLYVLGDQGNAPKFLKKIKKQLVPINAILISLCFAAICILISKVIP